MNTITLPSALELPAALVPLVKSSFRTGSRVICKPAPQDTDDDWVVLVDDVNGFREAAVADPSGWEVPDSDAYPDGWQSLRGPNHLNLIVTSDAQFYQRFQAATSVAKRLNLLFKFERVALFQAVLYGRVWEDS